MGGGAIEDTIHLLMRGGGVIMEAIGVRIGGGGGGYHKRQ